MDLSGKLTKDTDLIFTKERTYNPHHISLFLVTVQVPDSLALPTMPPVLLVAILARFDFQIKQIMSLISRNFENLCF
jgi:hypothetical protein